MSLNEPRHRVLVVVIEDGSDAYEKIATAGGVVSVDTAYGAFGETTEDEAFEVAQTLVKFAEGI